MSGISPAWMWQQGLSSIRVMTTPEIYLLIFGYLCLCPCCEYRHAVSKGWITWRGLYSRKWVILAIKKTSYLSSMTRLRNQFQVCWFSPTHCVHVITHTNAVDCASQWAQYCSATGSAGFQRNCIFTKSCHSPKLTDVCNASKHC